MEVSQVRKQIVSAIEQAKARGQHRRQRAVEAEQSYGQFLETVATPVARQVCQALKAEGYPFTVFTPSGGLRLASDHGRDDYIELSLDAASDPPQVLGRSSRVRGSRTLTDERAIKPVTPPSELSEGDVLAYFVSALEPWFER